MSDTTITSANSVFVILVPELALDFTLQGYSADRAFETDAFEISEVMMGVDGRMTAGYTPMPVKQTISLQADSPSKFNFNIITQAMKTLKTVFYMSGTIVLPATGEAFSLTRGILTQTKQIPDAQKVLQPMEYVITWESVNSSLI